MAEVNQTNLLPWTYQWLRNHRVRLDLTGSGREVFFAPVDLGQGLNMRGCW